MLLENADILTHSYTIYLLSSNRRKMQLPIFGNCIFRFYAGGSAVYAPEAFPSGVPVHRPVKKNARPTITCTREAAGRAYPTP